MHWHASLVASASHHLKEEETEDSPAPSAASLAVQGFFVLFIS